jgi:hypothetical protein
VQQDEVEEDLVKEEVEDLDQDQEEVKVDHHQDIQIIEVLIQEIQVKVEEVHLLVILIIEDLQADLAKIQTGLEDQVLAVQEGHKDQAQEVQEAQVAQEAQAAQVVQAIQA